MRCPIDWEEVGFVAFCAVAIIVLLEITRYAQESIKSKARLNNAKAQVLEGLDLRDQETRRVLRKLFVGEDK